MVKSPLKQMKKFRFQLLASFILENYEKCKIADIGGGKGILSDILINEGWDCTVIDPEVTSMPRKYKALNGKKVITGEKYIEKAIIKEFSTEMGINFDLLISLHGHGCNLRIIDAAAEYNKKFIILPCCIINEGIDPYTVTDWIEYLKEYAIKKGLEIKSVKLNFKGQRTAIYN